MGRFHQYLSFHLDFQLQKLVLALKMEIFEEELEIISRRECWNVIVVDMEVRGDGSVSGCMLGLTRMVVVVVEIWGEVPPHSEICAIFGVGGEKLGNNFVESGVMPF